MQFMSIFTWEPGRNGEAMERAAEKTSDGMIVINEWIDPGSDTVFRLVGVEESAALLKAGYPRGNPGGAGMHPGTEAKETLRHPGR